MGKPVGIIGELLESVSTDVFIEEKRILSVSLETLLKYFHTAFLVFPIFPTGHGFPTLHVL